jgi:hypothetical protein
VAKALTQEILTTLKRQAHQAITDHSGTILSAVPVAPETLLALVQHSEQRADLIKSIKAIDDVRVGQHNHILAIPREIVADALAKLRAAPDIEFEEITPSHSDF